MRSENTQRWSSPLRMEASERKETSSMPSGRAALKADVIYACGPTPMLKALKAYAAENGIECWISLEEKMACGIGACLGCVCHSKDVDEHSNVKNKRVCKDGPVFLADEVELLSSEEQRERIAGGCMCGTVKVKED